MRNPYITDRPLTAEDLYQGRDESFGRLAEGLHAGQRFFLLYGKAFSGKTSFINQIRSRLGEHYSVHRIDLDTLEAKGLPLWAFLVGVGGALGVQPPDRRAFDMSPDGYAFRYLSASAPVAAAATCILCLDHLSAAHLAADKESPGEHLLAILHRSLANAAGLALLVAIEGQQGISAPPAPPAVGLRSGRGEAIPTGWVHLTLGPLREDETSDLLAFPVRGTMAYDPEAMRRIHHLTGGQPFFVQVFGRILFEERSRAGWVGLPEVDKAIGQVVALAAAEFASTWEACPPAARIVLCSFGEMIGHYGLGTVQHIADYLAHQGVQIPLGDVAEALQWLVGQGIIEQLGNETFRIRNELFRQWLRQNKRTLDTVRQVRRYRRIRVPPAAPVGRRPVDWVGILLWTIAGLLVFLIAFVWRSRQSGLVWLIEHTPMPGSTEMETPTPIPTVIPATEQPLLVQGRIVYMMQNEAGGKWQVYVMRGDGSDPVRLTKNESSDTGPVLSPDGRRIAFVTDRDGNREIYVMNADGTDQSNLTQSPADDWTPCWSPDAKRIAFASFRNGNWEIYVMDANGANVRRLTKNGVADYDPAWSPDGQSIAFVSNRDGNLEIFIMSADGSNQRRFTHDKATDESPTWSADGSQLAWESYRDNNMEIYVARADGSELRNVSQDPMADDHGPAWSPQGRRIAFFSNRDRGWDIYTVDLDTGERTNLTHSPPNEQSPHWGP